MSAPKSAAGNVSAALLLTVSLFAVWAFGHQLYDSLLPQFTRVFALTGLRLAFTQSVYSLIYVVGAIPAALYARRFGYKATILFGLGMFCIGSFLFYPATETHAFSYFTSAVAVMSCGWIFLEIGANPLVMMLGRPETAVQRLNLAQAFYMPGSILGFCLGGWLLDSNLVLPTARLANAIVHPYIIVGAILLVLAFLVDDIEFPVAARERVRGIRNAAGELRSLVSRPAFRFAVIAQFFSVVALSGSWTPSAAYFAHVLPSWSADDIRNLFLWLLLSFGLGRFLGTALMMRFSPEGLLAAFALVGSVISVAATIAGGYGGVCALIAISFFLSILWPTILGLAIRDLGPQMKLGTALICMGGALGGFGYRLVDLVWTPADVRQLYWVPAVCFAAVLLFALRTARLSSLAAAKSAPGMH